ncbi:hypothetical protein [uncultured Parabacteroides sp.]|nr:hypothetical protein [uncultured Parabacteroides sp.]
MARHDSCQGYTSALRAALTAIAPSRVLGANGVKREGVALR